MRVTSFDVLVINKIPNMTSGGCATQMLDESQVKRRKG